MRAAAVAGVDERGARRARRAGERGDRAVVRMAHDEAVARPSPRGCAACRSRSRPCWSTSADVEVERVRAQPRRRELEARRACASTARRTACTPSCRPGACAARVPPAAASPQALRAIEQRTSIVARQALEREQVAQAAVGAQLVHGATRPTRRSSSSWSRARSSSIRRSTSFETSHTESTHPFSRSWVSRTRSAPWPGGRRSRSSSWSCRRPGSRQTSRPRPTTC